MTNILSTNDKRQALIAAALAGLCSLSVGSANAEEGGASAHADKEICYGVSKAGENDCADRLCMHKCSGMGLKDNDLAEWKFVPKGTCKQLGGDPTLQPRFCPNEEKREQISLSDEKGDPKKGEALYRDGDISRKIPPCAACHGYDGNSQNPYYPKLTSQYAAYTTRQLDEFRALKRVNPIMNGVAKNLTDTDILNISTYLGGLTTISAGSAQIDAFVQQGGPDKNIIDQNRLQELASLKRTGIESGKSFRDCTDKCPDMLPIPSGSFIMGSPATEVGRFLNENQHKVNIKSAFAVSKFPITFDEWESCAKAGGCGNYYPSDEGYGRGDRPVINVSWNDAQQYLTWLSKKTGKKYRLLSAAEWEYAARAGTTTRYYWGEDPSHDYANYGEEKNPLEPSVGITQGNDKWIYTSPVGSFPPNQFGLFDMLGNVWQWTQDCYNADYTGAPSDGSPWLKGNCNIRIMRGGSWQNGERYIRPALNYAFAIETRSYNIGFRVARMLP